MCAALKSLINKHFPAGESAKFADSPAGIALIVKGLAAARMRGQKRQQEGWVEAEAVAVTGCGAGWAVAAAREMAGWRGGGIA